VGIAGGVRRGREGSGQLYCCGRVEVVAVTHESISGHVARRLRHTRVVNTEISAKQAHLSLFCSRPRGHPRETFIICTPPRSYASRSCHFPDVHTRSCHIVHDPHPDRPTAAQSRAPLA
jgi:hypothetical protein